MKINATTDLTNVFTAKGTASSMITCTTDNKVYVWGKWVDWTLVPSSGGGVPPKDFSYATLAPTPPVPFTMIGVYQPGNGSYSSLKGLGTDGKIYSLGQHYDRPITTGALLTTRPTTGSYVKVQNYPASLWKTLLPNNTNPDLRFALTWEPDKMFDGNDLSGIDYISIQSDIITQHSATFTHQNMGKNILGMSESGTSFLYYLGYAGTNNNTNGYGYGEIPGTNLIYIRDHVAQANGPGWAISADGKVCVSPYWPVSSGLHDGGDGSGVLFIFDMNMFGPNGLNNFSNLGQRPRNGMWICGNPTLADGTPFVPYGTSLKVAGAGSIDCSKTQLIPAPISGTATQTDLVLTVNVTTAGTFTPSVSGSGMTLVDPDYTITTTTTGIQTFHIPIRYNGATALGTLTFTLSPATPAAGCTADLTKGPKNTITPVWTLDCVPTVGPGLK